MPKKPVFDDWPYYIIVYTYNGSTHIVDCVGARVALDTYRVYRSMYGNSVRMAKVVLNYGQEV